jgi:LAO/AO transport system kinase
VDYFLLLMLSGAGDELQGVKKGIMEMADAILINKADGENITAALQAKSIYQNALHLLQLSENNWKVPVLTGSALTGEGIQGVWDSVMDYQQQTKLNGFWDQNRANQRLNWLDDQVDFLLRKAFQTHPIIQKKLLEQRENVRKGILNPMIAAGELMSLFLGKEKF